MKIITNNENNKVQLHIAVHSALVIKGPFI